tara:strand:- start:1488 stop:2144 length:657 start_codon:yes stop_codon:yes gene_type:complete
MARELTSNKRKKVMGEYKGKRKLATKRLADVTKEELQAWEKRTGKKGLRAYLNAQRTIKSKGERLQPGDTFRQSIKKARDAKPKTATKTREQYAAASQKAGTSAAGMKPKKVDKKPTGGGSDKIMEKKRSLVDTIRNKLSNLKLRDAAGEKLEEKRRGRNRTSPALRGGGMVKKTGMRGGGMVKKTGMKKGGMVKKTGMRKKSIDGIARRGKTRGTNR